MRLWRQVLRFLWLWLGLLYYFFSERKVLCVIVYLGKGGGCCKLVESPLVENFGNFVIVGCECPLDWRFCVFVFR